MFQTTNQKMSVKMAKSQALEGNFLLQSCPFRLRVGALSDAMRRFSSNEHPMFGSNLGVNNPSPKKITPAWIGINHTSMNQSKPGFAGMFMKIFMRICS